LVHDENLVCAQDGAPGPTRQCATGAIGQERSGNGRAVDKDERTGSADTLAWTCSNALQNRNSRRQARVAREQCRDARRWPEKQEIVNLTRA
jgi:hypothetical protein